MEFVFETAYNQQSITKMAQVMRKTIRKKRSSRTHIIGYVAIILVVLLLIAKGKEAFSTDVNNIITWVALIIMILTLIFEDKLNGYVARKRMLQGMTKTITVFKEDGYNTSTDLGKTEWYYNSIYQIAETDDYFVFIFDQSHAQIYDKKGITKGTIDEFRKFISQKTEKEIQKVK